MSQCHPNVLFIGAFSEGQLRASFSQPIRQDNAHARLVGQSDGASEMKAGYYTPFLARNVETAKTRLMDESFDIILIQSELNDMPGDYGNMVKAHPRGEALLKQLRDGELGERNQHKPIIYMQSNLYNGAHLNDEENIQTVMGTYYYDHMDEALKDVSIFDRVKQALEKLLPDHEQEAYVGV